MNKINREDMLELTRRMTVKRNCFDRIAGAYFDEEGFVDGTFNTHFLKLKTSEQAAKLGIAKQIPFSETNVNLKEYSFSADAHSQGEIWQLLMALKDCALKNDALLDVFYEMAGERYRAEGPYAVYVFHGSYDIPRKASDKAEQWESEEVYQFLICAFCPVYEDYEPGPPECGFLFPAFTDRSANVDGIAVFQAEPHHPHSELERELLFVETGIESSYLEDVILSKDVK